MASVGSVSATGNTDIDGLLSGLKWVGTLTYSFPDSTSDYTAGYGFGEPTALGFGQVSAAQQQAVHRIMSLVEGYTELNIDYAGTNGADIRIAQSSEANPTAYAYYPGSNEGGDVWFGTSENYRSPTLGDYAYATHIHELGHALGLKHSHEIEGPGNTAVPSAHDSLEWTVMSYRAYVGAPLTGYTAETYGYPTTFMRNDIRALQEMYGADFTTQGGDTIYAWSPTTGEFSIDGVGQGAPGGNIIFMTLWDGGGIDTYDLSAYTTGVSINLTPGEGSTLAATQLANLGNSHIASASVYNAYLYGSDDRSYIENATGGSAGDALTGNAISNTLDGRAGNDTLTGGAASDVFVFGAGYGSDLITDFAVTGGDVVDISALTSFATLQDVLAIGTQSGANAILTFSIGQTLTFQNVSLAALSVDDFVFAGGSGGTGGGTGGTGGVNLAPTSISLTKSTISENVTGGTVGTVMVADGNGDTSFTFAVSDSRFAVTGSPGAYQLGLKAGQTLDYETQASIALSITATDEGGLALTQGLTIDVVNVAGSTISGTTGNDTVNATVGVGGKKATGEADTINGLDGADILDGLGDNDTLNGGTGNDKLYGGSGNDMLQGGTGADTIDGGTNGLAGDTVSYILSTAGVTVNLGLAGAQTSAGEASGDILTGIENIVGSGYADTLTGNGIDNVIEGGAGNDVLAGGANGTFGDTVSYAGALAGVKVSLAVTGAQSTGGGGVDTLSGFENATGTKHADTIEGNAGANRLDGGAGIDTLSYSKDTAGVTVRLDGSLATGGSAQGDKIIGFENLVGGAGNDVLTGTTGINSIDGGAGNDRISGAGGADILIGGIGHDIADFGFASSGVAISLAKTTAQTFGTSNSVTLSGVEGLSGSAYADSLTGNAAANTLTGGSGSDTIQGGAGADTMDGGTSGATGDTVSYSSSLAGVTVNLSLGAVAQVSAGDANGDKLSGFENVAGSAYADTLTGDGMNNVLDGGAGNDILAGGTGSDTASYLSAAAAVNVSLALTGAQSTGGAGVDTLSGFENLLGSKHADTLTGNSAANILTGGNGLDILTGGGGADTFDFMSLADKGDRITDFVAGVDSLQIRASGFAGATAGTVKFAAGGNPAPGTGTGWLLYDTDDGRLYYDADGAGAGLRQLLVTFDTAPSLSAGDFFVV